MDLTFKYKVALVLAVLKNPTLYKTALIQYRRFIPDKWYKVFPYLPKSPKEFLNFRLYTMYGEELPKKEVFVSDSIYFLQWCKGINPKIQP